MSVRKRPAGGKRFGSGGGSKRSIPQNVIPLACIRWLFGKFSFQSLMLHDSDNDIIVLLECIRKSVNIANGTKIVDHK